MTDDRTQGGRATRALLCDRETREQLITKERGESWSE